MKYVITLLYLLMAICSLAADHPGLAGLKKFYDSKFVDKEAISFHDLVSKLTPQQIQAFENSIGNVDENWLNSWHYAASIPIFRDPTQIGRFADELPRKSGAINFDEFQGTVAKVSGIRKFYSKFVDKSAIDFQILVSELTPRQIEALDSFGNAHKTWLDRCHYETGNPIFHDATQIGRFADELPITKSRPVNIDEVERAVRFAQNPGLMKFYDSKFVDNKAIGFRDLVAKLTPRQIEAFESSFGNVHKSWLDRFHDETDNPIFHDATQIGRFADELPIKKPRPINIDDVDRAVKFANASGLKKFYDSKFVDNKAISFRDLVAKLTPRQVQAFENSFGKADESWFDLYHQGTGSPILHDATQIGRFADELSRKSEPLSLSEFNAAVSRSGCEFGFMRFSEK